MSEDLFSTPVKKESKPEEEKKENEQPKTLGNKLTKHLHSQLFKKHKESIADLKKSLKSSTPRNQTSVKSRHKFRVKTKGIDYLEMKRKEKEDTK